LQLIERNTHFVAPRRRLQITTDVADNMFLECADAARVDYLITGNLRHFPRYWKRTKIITSREFLNLTAPHLL
jgi:predicted nucleic acid-binding protein